jgi:hypothetical protein
MADEVGGKGNNDIPSKQPPDEQRRLLGDHPQSVPGQVGANRDHHRHNKRTDQDVLDLDHGRTSIDCVSVAQRVCGEVD